MPITSRLEISLNCNFQAKQMPAVYSIPLPYASISMKMNGWKIDSVRMEYTGISSRPKQELRKRNYIITFLCIISEIYAVKHLQTFYFSMVIETVRSIKPKCNLQKLKLNPVKLWLTVRVWSPCQQLRDLLLNFQNEQLYILECTFKNYLST